MTDTLCELDRLQDQVSKVEYYYWHERSECWERHKSEAYVHKPSGQVVANISYFQSHSSSDVRVVVYVDKPGDTDAATPDVYTFVDIDSAKKFVVHAFKKEEE